MPLSIQRLLVPLKIAKYEDAQTHSQSAFLGFLFCSFNTANLNHSTQFKNMDSADSEG